MKKVLLFVLAAFFACYTMNAQTLLEEGFESGIPATWTTIDNDGDGENWADASSILAGWGYSASDFSNTGSNCAMSISYDDASAASFDADNYLVTPQLSIPSAGAVLSFYVRSIAGTYPDDYMVKLSTSGNAAANFTVTLQDLETASGSWTNVEIDLSDYAGQSVYIAFVHQTSDMYALLLDDVTVSGLSATPEISLIAVTLPTTGPDAGANFNVGGTIKNLSAATLTSFDVTYSVNGGANVATYTVNGINVATNETYDFTHNVPASVNEVGVANVTVTVSNPNGTADNTADNTLTGGVSICGLVTEFPYTEGFETGVGCWTPVSMNTENTASNYGAYNLGASAHGGENIYLFNSYTEADDYAQYIISPELSLTSAAELKLYHVALSSNGSETFSIMTSTTTSDIASFTDITGDIASSTSWTEASATLAANVKYVAIKYTSEYQYYLGIDDISITVMSNDPEIALTSITTPTTASAGANVNVSGVVSNNSGAELTSFDVVYTFDGAASSTYNVTGINVAAGETYAFTHNAPINNIAGGDHTLVVTVSNPNGVADNTADNSLSMTISACSAVNAPYTETFDNELECWTTIDADGDGKNWMTMGEWLTDVRGSSSNPGSLSYGGTGNAMISESYRSSALTPDNWLISPAIVLPSDGTYAATWYAKSQDASYPDPYSVYVGTSSDIATLGASTAVYSGTAEDDFTQHAAILDAYAGQTVYVAFRHHNVSDQFVLIIDQFEVKAVSTTPEIALTSATTPGTVAMNTAFVVNGTVVNNCASPLTSFDATVTVNGQTVNQQITGINVPYLGSYSFAVDAPAIAAAGNYDVTLTVSNPNGVADVTTDNTQTTSVNIYDASTSVPRATLLENFTTAVCPNCPSGHDRIESAIGTTYANNVIWVSHHSGYYTDALTSTLDQTMMTFFNDGGATYAPAVMLDRTYWGEEAFTYYDGEYAPGPVFLPQNDVANALALATSQPAFVTVNVATPTYNATTRALSVTVSGNVSGALATDDARLNVWLLEDGLLADGGSGVGHGPSQSGASGTFYHNHVIRENLSGDDWGEANVVNTAAGTNYTKTYTTTVSNNYDASKCYIVAFVSSGNHSNVNNCKVFNAGKSAYLSAGDTPGPGPQPQGIDDVNAANVKLYPNPTTGNLYIEVEGLQKVEIIDAVGRVVMSQNNGNVINMSNLANGIYTVRVMANGNTAVKKVVKK